MEVMQLPWSPFIGDRSNDYIADTPIGNYVLFKDFETGKVTVYYNGNRSGYLSTQAQSYDEAKEIAQEDFKNRINKCLK